MSEIWKWALKLFVAILMFIGQLFHIDDNDGFLL